MNFENISSSTTLQTNSHHPHNNLHSFSRAISGRATVFAQIAQFTGFKFVRLGLEIRKSVQICLNELWTLGCASDPPNKHLVQAPA